MKKLIIAAAFAVSAMAAYVPVSHAGSCQTTCQWIGDFQYCNTYCY
jgi:hypothetical protein